MLHQLVATKCISESMHNYVWACGECQGASVPLGALLRNRSTHTQTVISVPSVPDVAPDVCVCPQRCCPRFTKARCTNIVTVVSDVWINWYSGIFYLAFSHYDIPWHALPDVGNTRFGCGTWLSGIACFLSKSQSLSQIQEYHMIVAETVQHLPFSTIHTYVCYFVFVSDHGLLSRARLRLAWSTR